MIRVEGDERIIRGLASSALIGDKPQLLRSAAEIYARGMRANAPRDTGHLIESIEVRETETGYEIGPDPSGFYGFFLEFGTSKMPARPWFRPAADRALRFAAAEIGRAYGVKFERVWR